MAGRVVIEADGDDGGVIGADVCASIASVVRRVREGLGWSQRELARRAGYDRSTLRRLERGERVTVAVARAHLQALGISLRWSCVLEPHGSQPTPAQP